MKKSFVATIWNVQISHTGVKAARVSVKTALWLFGFPSQLGLPVDYQVPSAACTASKLHPPENRWSPLGCGDSGWFYLFVPRFLRLSGSFESTAAVVTGASSGIGRAIAIGLAHAGVSRIAVHYRKNLLGAQQTAFAIEETGATAVAIPADLADPEHGRRLIDRAFDELGPIQTWVNNAGADVLTGDAGAWNFERKLKHLMDVDVIGTIGLSRQVAERLAAQNSLSQDSSSPPSMVFLGWDQSSAGMEGDAGQMFGPVKAAVTAFAKSLAQSMAPKVRINTVAPGWIQTSWGEKTSEYWDSRAKDQSLMGRWGSPDDIAKAVCYLADPANSFLTGQTLEVNGGWSRRYDADR
ncbi:SDR family NAD(P)-dependent oxidoreductase [Rubripirellula reticaptiva]|uniref:3-oxoacyl-[acyl-carrier-protein] reductase FabG n=1 Tax=Rubripirellula reticaptiva TaxID=2528013 RepID=A0A5C6F6T9_9BACT|nr:SDR family oxidoreductase [Rubripirellula reticaptiva]TWU55806.1 3-oxoacyl-[acyl-carrier-protein] reductase FabG [Rubripirellula reticaptiva]